MDKIILGILMLKRLTVYEIRNIIRKNFKSMCSDSLGSIQAVMKKLLAEQLVVCSEFVEKSVNKKQYSITDAGREALMLWLKTPANMSKSKNIELGKLLFMGLVPTEERCVLIDEIILILEKELSELQMIQTNVQHKEKDQVIAYFKNDEDYFLGIQKATGITDVLDNVNTIGEFQAITLQFGIDSTEFQLNWFKKLRKKINNIKNDNF